MRIADIKKAIKGLPGYQVATLRDWIDRLDDRLEKQEFADWWARKGAAQAESEPYVPLEETRRRLDALPRPRQAVRRKIPEPAY